MVDQDMITMVPIFHAQNLLHILKKKKARIKFMNFSQKYMGSVFFLFGVTLYIGIMFRVLPGFNSRSSHTKDSKMELDASLLNTQHQVRVKGKWRNQ